MKVDGRCCAGHLVFECHGGMYCIYAFCVVSLIQYCNGVRLLFLLFSEWLGIPFSKEEEHWAGEFLKPSH